MPACVTDRVGLESRGMEMRYASFRRAAYIVLGALTCTVLAASDNVIVSVHSERDSKPAANRNSSFWKKIQGVTIANDSMGRPAPEYRTEVRSRWTRNNLYLLFVCRYEKLWLRPNPELTAETNELWNWDVAEAFIAGDIEHVNRYREFEVSPRGEWVDLAIDRGAPRQAGVGGWTWNSGFQKVARVDEKQHLWYAEMVIPWSALMATAPAVGGQLRANLFLSVGPTAEKKNLSWQATHSRTFHVPDAFGILKLEKGTHVK